MGVVFTANAEFRARDQLSSKVIAMSRNVTRFAQKSQAGLAQVEMRFRAINRRASKLLGKLGQLGLGFSALMIVQQVAIANIELDDSLASLSAITGKTGVEFVEFKKQVSLVAKEQTKFAGDTAKAFEIVASAQPILLENAKALGVVTNASIVLSKASGDDLAISAGNLTGVMNQFNLEANEAGRVMNILAAGSVAGSANITNVALSMKNFGAVAANANISVEKAVALVEVMGSKSIFAEEAGTKLRSTIVSLQKAGLGYESGLFNINDALNEANNKLNSFSTAKKKDAYLLKIFGKQQITTGSILLNNISKFEELEKAVTGTNTAYEQADIKANTFSNRLQEIKDSFKNAVVATDSQSSSMNKLKDFMLKVTENMEKIISIAINLIKWFMIYRAAMFSVIVAQKLLAATIAIAKFVKFIGIVMKIAKAKGAWAAAQWVLNIALNANPISLIIIAIIALVAAIVIIIKKYDEWGAALTFLLGPLGMIINIIQSFRKNWELVTASFKDGGILRGLLTIGKVLIDALLMPIQQILEIAGKIPGLGIASTGAEKIQSLRNKMFDYEKSLIGGQETKTLETSKTVQAKESIKREERVEKQQAEIFVRGDKNVQFDINAAKGFPIKLSSTL